MFRIILLFACALLAVQSAAAQTPDEFRRRLAEPSVDEESGREARVTVTESDDAARTVSAAAAGRSGVRFQGYRLGLYSDNGQDAHESSLAAKSTFEANFPGINVYWVYDNPYFKVTAGDCLTEEEAVMLLERVRTLFPKAYIVRAEMTVANIIISPAAEPDDSPATAEEE